MRPGLPQILTVSCPQREGVLYTLSFQYPGPDTIPCIPWGGLAVRQAITEGLGTQWALAKAIVETPPQPICGSLHVPGRRLTACRSRSTQSVWPESAARCSAVRPVLPAVALSEAPVSSSMPVAPARPAATRTDNGTSMLGMCMSTSPEPSRMVAGWWVCEGDHDDLCQTGPHTRIASAHQHELHAKYERNPEMCTMSGANVRHGCEGEGTLAAATCSAVSPSLSSASTGHEALARC